MKSSHLNESIDGLAVYMRDIYSMILDRQIILIRRQPYYEQIENFNPGLKIPSLLAHQCLDEKKFNMVKFKYISYLKTQKKPEDRVGDFECYDINGVFDWDTYERLVEARKTKIEKNIDRMQELQMREYCRNNGLDYYGPLR